jgi:alkylhydroperoxidase family enzyme
MEGTRGPRIGPGSREEVGFANAAILRVLGLATGGRAPNVFTTLARNRRLFRRWLWFAGGLMPGGKLARVDTELVILRVADNAGSAYEWGHHERLGRRAGLTPEEIERVRSGPAAPGWSERQRLLLAAADEMHGDGRIGDATWAGLAADFDEPRLIELCLLIGHYEMLAMTLNSLGVEPEAPSGRLG